MAATDNMTEATPSVRPIIENTGATATAAAETLMKTIAMDGNRINIPIDVRQVAERLGLEVQYLLLDSGTDGMIVKEAGRPCKVVVDALAHTHRRRFTLAHEIGHYVQKYQKYALGDEGGEIDYRDERSSKGTEPDERWANGFAAALLMPASAVRQFWAQGMTPEQLAEAFNVSQRSMNWVNTAALVMSFRRLTLEAPHCLQRHLVVPLLVVPLRFISPPQWQRGWFFDIATPHHAAHSTSRLPHRGFPVGG